MAISDLDYADDSDVALIRRTRTGDADAYGNLHRRHVGAARALAWRMSRSASDADDLVSEGFARVLSALQRGSGPEVAFRPYLLSTIRRLAYDRTDRERRESPVEYELDEPTAPLEDPVLAGFEKDAAAAAFASLPERWRLVLWHTEVEGQKPAEVAELLGIKPNAVAALAYRAREGLRQAYLSHHATALPSSDHECRLTNDRLAAYVRGGLAPGHEERVRRHLDECDDCRAAHLELANVNTALRGLVGLAILGPAAAAYLSEVAAPTAPVGPGPTHAAHGSGPRGTSGAGGGTAAGDASLRAPAAGAASLAAAALARRRARVAVAVAASVVGLAAVAGWFATRPGHEVVDLADRRSTSTAAPEVVADPTGESEEAVVESSTTEATSPFDLLPVPVAPSVRTHGARAPRAVPEAPPAGPVRGEPGSRGIGSPFTPAGTGTTTTTTSVPATTTTTTAVPPPPAALDVGLASAGKLVDGRDGTVVASVANTGTGAAGDVVVDLDLAPLVLRGVPDQPGWTCQASGPSALRCRSAALAAGAGRTVYVPVIAPTWSGTMAVRATASGRNAPASPGESISLAVEPTGMSARVATVDHGDVIATGGSLLTCPSVVPADACALARAGTAAPDAPSLNNNAYAMVPVDVDADPTTANSSSAPLVLPAGSQVLSATLFTGADTSAGDGGTTPSDPEEARRHAVLTSPSGTATPVTADQVDAIGSQYQAVADVTALVRAGGAGTWTVGGVAVGTGADRYGGWTLVVVVRQASAPLRSLVVLDGLGEVGQGAGAVELGVGGYLVPAAGASHASLTVAAYEGDLGTAGDSLSLVSGGVTTPAGGVVDDNVFDSSAPGPGDRNRFGYDLDRFDVAGALAAGSTDATIRLTTSGDTYLPGVVIFTVDQ